MKIIDKYTDFYDYYSHVYGIDPAVTFDRRGSTPLTNDLLYPITLFDYTAYGFSYRNQSIFHLLEFGNTQYIIRTDNHRIKKKRATSTPLDEYVEVSKCRLSIEHVYKNHIHFSPSPIAIYPLKLKEKVGKNWWREKVAPADQKYIIPSLDEIIRQVVTQEKSAYQLPILKDTIWTKLLDPEEIWKELQSYLASLKNDIDVSLEMTEKQKAETHGFDKYSFRHPVK